MKYLVLSRVSRPWIIPKTESSNVLKLHQKSVYRKYDISFSLLQATHFAKCINCIHSTYLIDSAGRPAVSLGSDPLEGKTPVAENRITENHVAVDFGQHRGVTDPRRSHTLLFDTLRFTHQRNSLLFGFLLRPWCHWIKGIDQDYVLMNLCLSKGRV